MSLNEEGDAMALLDDFSVLPDTDPNEMAEANTKAELDPITAELNAAEALLLREMGQLFCQCRRKRRYSRNINFFAEAKLDREQGKTKTKRYAYRNDEQ